MLSTASNPPTGQPARLNDLDAVGAADTILRARLLAVVSNLRKASYPNASMGSLRFTDGRWSVAVHRYGFDGQHSPDFVRGGTLPEILAALDSYVSAIASPVGAAA